MNSLSSSSPEVTDAGLAAEPLRALRRGLTRANGFALYVAVVKTPAQRNELIRLLAEAMPAVKLQILTIRTDSTDILEEVQKQLGGKLSGPVMVAGLEDALPSDAKNHPILNALNLRRPDWPQLIPQPVVFWVPEYVLGILARSAPDFLDWRSDTVHFPDIEPIHLQILDASTWDRGMDTRMPVHARLERVKELESRLIANEENQDPVVQRTLVEWLNELGLHYLLLGRTNDALESFKKVYATSQKLGDRVSEAVALGNVGNTYFRLGEMDKAVDFGEKALITNRETRNRHYEANTLISLGAAYAGLGDYDKAINYYGQGLSILRDVQDRLAESQALNNLGVVYKNLGDFAQAIEFYEQSLTLKRVMGDRKGESGCLHNLGNVYARLGDTRKAMEFLERALTISREIGDRHGQANALGNLGVVYKQMGDMVKATACLDECLEFSKEIGDRRAEGIALFNLAVLSNELGNKLRAIRGAEAALKIFNSIRDPKVTIAQKALAEFRKELPLNLEH